MQTPTANLKKICILHSDHRFSKSISLVQIFLTHRRLAIPKFQARSARQTLTSASTDREERSAFCIAIIDSRKSISLVHIFLGNGDFDCKISERDALASRLTRASSTDLEATADANLKKDPFCIAIIDSRNRFSLADLSYTSAIGNLKFQARCGKTLVPSTESRRNAKDPKRRGFVASDTE
jgi:hypothetical protein